MFVYYYYGSLGLAKAPDYRFCAGVKLVMLHLISYSSQRILYYLSLAFRGVSIELLFFADGTWLADSRLTRSKRAFTT